jgi:hypothetical protein
MHLLFLLVYLSLLFNIIINNPFYGRLFYLPSSQYILDSYICICTYTYIHVHIQRLNLTDDTLTYLVYMDRWIRYLVALLSLLAIKSYSLFIHLSLLQQYTSTFNIHQ